MPRRKAPPRNRTADLLWGARNGVVLTAIVLVPAALAALGGGSREFPRFIAIAGVYLAFGLVAGWLAGIARPRLAQKGVAVVTGALIGALGFSLLLSSADSQHASKASLILNGAVLGLVVGASLGWWAWKRARAWRLR